MAGKLLALLAGGKAAVLSGVLVASSAALTLGAGPQASTPAPEKEAPAEIVEMPATVVGAATPIPHRDRAEPTPTPVRACDEHPAVRGETRAAVQDAYDRYHASIERLRSERGASRYAATLTNADAMLRTIVDTADRAIADLPACSSEAAPEASVEGLARQVAERAAAAMETVANLTRGATATAPATPAPAKPRATEKPKSKTCDERVAAAKKELTASFDRFHSANDKLLSAAKGSEAATAAVKSADKLIHSTFDATKARILRSGCTDGAGTALAAGAASTFEGAYSAAKGVVASRKR